MRHLDLFSGVGGFTIAAGWAGFETVGFSEVEPYCCKVLARHWPLIPNYGDLRRADFSWFRGSVTVLSAGAPCQPASLAGKRRGAGDDRWLWPATLDVVGVVRPAWCIFENPPGIAHIHAFKEVMLCLGDMGYQIAGFDVSAEAVGANFIGYRSFFVAAPASLRRGSGNVQRSNQEKEWRASSESIRCPGWKTEPPVSRVANGIPRGKYYLRALGNAVCPQQAFPFFAAIAQVEEAKR